MTRADQINAEHALGEKALGDAMTHFIECGRLLIKQKSELVHGEWLPWVEANLKFHRNTASNYMRLAEFADADPANAQRVVQMTMRAALREIAEAEATARVAAQPVEIPEPQPIEELISTALQKAGQVEASRSPEERMERTAHCIDTLANTLAYVRTQRSIECLDQPRVIHMLSKCDAIQTELNTLVAKLKELANVKANENRPYGRSGGSNLRVVQG